MTFLSRKKKVITSGDPPSSSMEFKTRSTTLGNEGPLISAFPLAARRIASVFESFEDLAISANLLNTVSA